MSHVTHAILLSIPLKLMPLSSCDRDETDSTFSPSGLPLRLLSTLACGCHDKFTKLTAAALVLARDLGRHSFGVNDRCGPAPAIAWPVILRTTITHCFLLCTAIMHCYYALPLSCTAVIMHCYYYALLLCTVVIMHCYYALPLYCALLLGTAICTTVCTDTCTLHCRCYYEKV